MTANENIKKLVDVNTLQAEVESINSIASVERSRKSKSLQKPKDGGIGITLYHTSS